MSDAQHTEQKEAIEDGIGRVAVYRGIALGVPLITRSTAYVTHDDGSVTGPSFTNAWKIDKVLKSVLDAWLDGKPLPAVPGVPPVVTPPVDPPPVVTPPVEPPATGAPNIGASQPDSKPWQPPGDA